MSLGLRHRSRRILPAAWLLCLALTARGSLAGTAVETGRWISIGPDGGSASVLAIDADPRTVYAGTGSMGVFRSRDGGRSWSRAVAGLLDPPAREIADLVTDPARPGTVYAATAGGLYKSVDAAATWSRTGAGLPSGEISGLALDPRRPRVLYAATPQGVFRSRDGGVSWTPTARFGESTWAKNVAIDPARPNGVWAVSLYGVYRSADAGTSWTAADLFDEAIEGTGVVLVDPSHPGTIYVGSKELRVSHDDGATWQVAGDPVRGHPTVLAASRSLPGRIFAGTEGGGLYRSADSGDTWSRVATVPDSEAVPALAIASGRKPFLHASLVGKGPGNDGLYRSSDLSPHASWTAESHGFRALDLESLAIDPRDGRTLWAGSGNGEGIFVSRDAGVSWSPSNTGLTVPSVLSLAVSAARPQVVYAATSRSVFRSADAGRHWVERNAGLGGPVDPVVASPADPRIAWALSGSVFRTENGGGRWLPPVPLPAILVDLAVAPSDPARLYVGGADFSHRDPVTQVLRSDDGGRTWLQSGLRAGGGVGALAVDPRDPDRVLAGGTILWITEDGGASWRGFYGPSTFFFPNDVAIDPVLPDRFYAVGDGGAFVSDDGGETWSGGSEPGMFAVVVDPAGTAYAAGTGGVWRLMRSGADRP
jgi:photosystem II stability/assembly factor-like uncharacterized protein